jgi:DNA-binding CsgD family transcriptional regulator
MVTGVQRARWKRGVANLERLCDAGLGVDEFRAESLRHLRSLITIDAAFYATVDAATMVMTSAWTEEPLASAALRFLDNENGANDVNRFTVLADSREPVRSLDQATDGSRGASPRYRDLMAPMGLGDEVRVVLRSRDRSWGVLCLHREDGEAGFADEELALLKDLAPLLGEGLRRGLAITSMVTGDPVAGGPGVLVLDRELSLVSANRQAERWLAEVDRNDWPAAVPLPIAVLSAASACLEQPDDDPPLGRTRIRRAGGGWMTVHASPLTTGRRDVVVVLDSADPDDLTSLVLAAHGLTPAQSRVAALVLRGRSTQQIVNELRISAHTVQEHLGAVFDKFGVGSRRELVAALMGRR